METPADDEARLPEDPPRAAGAGANAASALGGGGHAQRKPRLSKCWSRKLRFGADDVAADELAHRVKLLRAIPLFASLDAPELEAAARSAERGVVGEGEVLFARGEVGDACFVVDAGRAAVEVDGATVATYDAGGFFGEWALLRREVRAGIGAGLRIERRVAAALARDRLDGALRQPLELGHIIGPAAPGAR